MKIQQEVELAVTAKAVLREGKLSLSVNIAAPYGDRFASQPVESFPEEIVATVQAALQDAVDYALSQGVEVAMARAHEARIVATNRGEL